MATKLEVFQLLESEKDRIKHYVPTAEQNVHKTYLDEFFVSARELGQVVKEHSEKSVTSDTLAVSAE